MTGRVKAYLAVVLGISLSAIAGTRFARTPQVARDTGKKVDSTREEKTRAAQDKPEINVFLIGDAGAPAEHEPVLAALDKAVSEDPSHSIIVFLGDNIYPDGMPDSSSGFRKEAERRLDAQLAVAKSNDGARGIFIAGNHDWGGISGRDGWNMVRRQAAYIAAKGAGSSMIPEAGCPGPAVQDVGAVLRLVMLDTQWWLRRSGPPKSAREVVPCAFVSQKSVLDSIKTVIKTAEGRRVIMMAHHPLASQGPHGGHFSSKSQMFPLTSVKSWLRVPLPMVGSVYVAARRMGISEQDLSSSQNSKMVQSIMSTFSDKEPLVFAAGHEHALQVMAFRGAPGYLLVSGSGIYGHVNAVGSGGPTRFAKAESGFMQLRAWPDGRIRLTVLTVDHTGKATEAYNEWIAQRDPKKMAPKNAD